MQAIKPKLTVGEDGKIYAKGTDGSIMKDIISDKPITGQSLFSSMVESGAISKSALNGTVGSGTGGEGNQGNGTPLNNNVPANGTEMMKAGRKA